MKTLNKCRKRFENYLKQKSSKLSGRQQIKIIIIMLFLFFTLSLFVFGSAIYSIGINEGKSRIERINVPAAINNLNTNYHE